MVLGSPPGKAQRGRYKHRDMTDLEKQLREKADARIKLVRRVAGRLPGLPSVLLLSRSPCP